MGRFGILLLAVVIATLSRAFRTHVSYVGSKVFRLSSSSTDDTLGEVDDMTVVELKKVLRSMNLPVSGVKAALKARITSAAESKSAFAYGDRGGKAPSRKVVTDNLVPKHVIVSEHAGDSGEMKKDLWFDDSVFDAAEDASRGNDRRRNAMKDVQNNSMMEGRYGKAKHGVIGGFVSPNFSRGENVEATVLGFGTLGATVVIHKKDSAGVKLSDDELEAEGRGLVLQQEVTYWSAVNGGQPDIGQTLDAYILNIREDGKLDVTLRPVGYDKVMHGSNKVMDAIKNAPGGVLGLGPKSSPDQVWALLPGMSKREFKSSVGKIVNDGAAEIVDEGKGLRYIAENERVQAPKLPFSGKSPRGWRAPEGCTIFVANVPFTMDNMDLASIIEAKIGYGQIAALKVSTDPATGKARGFAHLEFFDMEATSRALNELQGLRANNRELRFELPYADKNSKGPVGSGEKRPVRDWGESSQHGRRTIDGQRVREVDPKEGGGAWTTVYAGNLAYAVTEASLKYSVEDALGPGHENIVAAVRIAVDRDDPSRKRGFGYVDFYDEESARMVCEKLGGMQIMGRAVQLDYEGPKKRAKFDDEANKSFIPGKNSDVEGKRRFRGGGGGGRGGNRGYRDGGGRGGGGGGREWSR